MLTVHLYDTATLMFWFHRFRGERCEGTVDGLHGRCMYFFYKFEILGMFLYVHVVKGKNYMYMYIFLRVA